MIKKTFKKFMMEQLETSLNSGLIKDINKDLFNFVKDAQPFDDIIKLIQGIVDILDGYDIIILGEDGRKFSGNIIESKGNKYFHIAPGSTKNDRNEYQEYTNVILFISWSEKNNEFIVKDSTLKGK